MPVSLEFMNWLSSQVKPKEGYTQKETFQAVTEAAYDHYGIECHCAMCNELTLINIYNENNNICDKCHHKENSIEYLDFIKEKGRSFAHVINYKNLFHILYFYSNEFDNSKCKYLREVLDSNSDNDYSN